MAGSGTGTVVMPADLDDGGLRADVERVVLRDGSSVVIRLLDAGDAAAIASWFTSLFGALRAEKLYARLYVLLERLDLLAKSARASGDRLGLEPIAAFAPDGVTVGIARCLPVGKSAGAEVMVAVAEAWHGRGLATALLERAVDRARSVDIEQLTARCLAGDDAFIGVLSRLGPVTIEPASAGLVNVRIDLGGRHRRPAARAGRVTRS
jgi:GNAT superfamily N-acetyltransferase